MESTLVPFLFGPLSRSERRFAWGLALSLAAHLLVIAGLRPVTAVFAPQPPLQVELRQVATEPEAPLSVPAAPDAPADMAPASPAAAAAKPAPARPEPGAVPELRPDSRLPLERYFTGLEVEVRAEPLNDPPLVYPQRAYQSRIRGKVILRILINERGGVDQVLVVESQPRGVFEEAAIDAARALRFSPALRFGNRVKSQKTVEVAFDPYESVHRP